MAEQELICGFCGRKCETSEDVGFLKFPGGEKKPAHLSHVGVKEEYERQENGKN